jgi:hypothetical protein
MPSGIYARPFAAALLYIMILISAAAAGATPAVAAQSGRKSKEKPPAPPPPAESSSRSTRSRRATTPIPPRFNVIVVKYIPSANLAFWTNEVYRRFVERLREAGDVGVVEGKEMNRKEAINLSKSEAGQNAYVIWLQLEVDVETGDAEKATVTAINPGCLFINYIMYAPGNGKVEAQGKVYQDGYQTVCVGAPSRPSPLPIPGIGSRRPSPEYTITKAARDAAGRILDALHD